MSVAKETIIKMIDDLDGGPADETVAFDFDGVSYEIDLSDKNAAKLRKALEPYVAKGTRVNHRVTVRSGGRGVRTTTGRSIAATDREQNKAIRAWAAKKKLDVAPRGRIKADIIEQYHRQAGR